MNGTRYGAKHIQVLKLGIGQAGINYGLMTGASFSIDFSGAQRTLELIFSSERSVAEFIGNVTMDVAKAIVTIFLTKITVAMVSGAASAMFGITILPISVGVFIVIGVGFVVTKGLIALDEHFGLSEKLITNIRKGLVAHQHKTEWNQRHGYATHFLR